MTIAATTTPAPNGKPAAWHKSPNGSSGPCPTCGCAGIRCKTFQHCRLGPLELWIIRWPSSAGWVYKSELNARAIGRQAEQIIAANADHEFALPEIAAAPDPIGELATVETKLVDFFDQVFRPLALRSRAANTIRLYRSTLNTFSKFLERSPRLADLNDDTVGRFLDWFKHLPRSLMSVNKERANLLTIWRLAARKRILDQFPDVAAEREPKRTPQAWLEPELAKLLAACRAAPGKIGYMPARSFWTALHLVLWDSGERISAVMALTWGLVDMADGFVRVPAEFRKCGTEDRLYKLRKETIAALKAIQRSPDATVFEWPYSRTLLWHKYKALLKRAGLPADRKSKFHRMRRSVASHAERAGGNATELLGHSSRKVTTAYLDPRLTGDRFASDILPPIASVDQVAGSPEPELQKLFRQYAAAALPPAGDWHSKRATTAIEGLIAGGIHTLADVQPDGVAAYLSRRRGDLNAEHFNWHRAAIVKFVRWLAESGICPAAADVVKKITADSRGKGGAS